MCQLVKCSLAQPTELSIDMSVCFKTKMNNLLLIKLNIIKKKGTTILSNFVIAKIFYLMWFVDIF